MSEPARREPAKTVENSEESFGVSTDDKLLIFIHALLALLAPLLIFALVGCSADDRGIPVDLGPEVPREKIGGAINDMLHDASPVDTKLGAFVQFAQSQAIAGGQLFNIVSDTGHTVINCLATADARYYEIVETKFTYKTGGGYEKLTRQLPMVGLRVPTALAAQTPSVIRAPITMEKAAELYARAKNASETPNDSKVTFHRLRSSESEGAPPLAVQRQPNCLNIPNCRVRYRTLWFEMVAWEGKEATPLLIQLVSSPDIPQVAGYKMSPVDDFIPGLVKSCLTQMVPVGDDGAKTMLTECQDVVNFRFKARPEDLPPNASPECPAL